MSDASTRQNTGRIRLMLSRIVLALVDDARKMQAVQLEAQAAVGRDKAEHFQHYGFTSVPFPGAEGIGLAIGGSSNHTVVINVDDRRYRLKGLEGGEMAIYDDQGQRVHLKRSGIVINGAGLPIVIEDTPTITMKASTKIRLETPLVEVTGLLRTQDFRIGLTSAGTATMSGGAINYTGVVSTYTGGSITHDGKNIGGTHNHDETGSTTLGPNP